MTALRTALSIIGLGWPVLLNAGSARVDNEPGKFVVQKGDRACTTLQRDFATLDKPKLPDVPDWKQTDVDLSSEMSSSTQEADFDFYNDGHIDRVFLFSYGSYTMQGTKILVQPGRSASSVVGSSGNPLDDRASHLYPCQLVNKDISVKDCSPPGLLHNDDWFSVSQSKTSPEIAFSVNFSELDISRVEGKTYMLVASTSYTNTDVVAVFYPTRGGNLDLVCVLHRGVAFIG